MIDGLKPYPEYKESGQRWIGQVPRQWASFPLCRVATPKSECGRTDLELLSVYLHRGVIRYADSGGQVHKPSLDLSKYQVVAPGDFVLNNQQAWRGSIGVSKFQGIISPAYVVLKLSPKLISGYANYLFRSPAMVAQYVAASRGVGDIQRNLFYPDLRNSIAIVPPPDEQVAIVRFLDHANRKIDGFVRAKRKLIGLLNEQKQAIIHRAVTRGLYPNVPLKPSGIPWLGDIPAHWERSRLKFEALHIVDCLHATPTYRADGAFPAIRTADIEPGKVRLDQARKISFEDFQKWTARLQPEMGDILYSREGERFGIAANVPADTSLCISQRMMVFRIRQRQDSEYLMWQLNCRHVYLQASLYVIGSTAPHVNVDQIKNFQLALPPVDEQKAIVEHIRAECSIIDTAIARTEREIALMQEYRTRLTADIVTGKLDVREAAAKLPDLPAEAAAESSADDEMDDTETEELEA